MLDYTNLLFLQTKHSNIITLKFMSIKNYISKILIAVLSLVGTAAFAQHSHRVSDKVNG
ncbi:hypothetical protein SAMN05216357_101286 [Porphyromonadaceae bacterium KH3CP3RA]|nr:hypothetical protein SAMN05216357_101286 [Porphyromonadaceae bacterium KH3CP3RA]